MNRQRIPWWFVVLCVILALPVFFIPLYDDMAVLRDTLGWLDTYYPVYIVAALLCALLCYPRRREVAWILIGIVIISHMSLIALSKTVVPY